jgi:type IV secretion system protein VirD4
MSGFVLGRWGWHVLRSNGEENVLLVGPARSGKGVNTIIPSALELEQEHLILIDVRGETWDATAGYRQTVSRCLRLSLTQPGSARFSLPQAIRVGTPHVFRDAAMLGDMMIDPGHNKPERDHWEKTAKALATCGLLYEAHKRTRPTLANMASFWSQPGKTPEQILKYVVETAPMRQVAELAQEVLNKAGNEASGVLSSMMTQLFLFRDDTLAANTATCDFHLEDFTRLDRWLSLYIVLSPGEEEYLRPFLRMFLRLALQRWLEIGATKHRIMLMLDEFTSWGRIQFLVHNLAVLGGRGIRTLLAVQNTPQLTATYGDADLITEQCKVRLYFGANGQSTGREISRQTGTGTATTLQQTWQRGQGWGRGSQQAQQHARALLTDAEATQIPPRRMVIQVTGHPPIWATKLKYWRRRLWRQRSRIPAPVLRGGRP